MSKIKIEERKIIPIAAMISVGKSMFLNVLFNIDFLECKAGIGTKFVNILRYNPNIHKPIFYHLIVEKENGKYVFYKDPNSEVKEGEKEIIEENKNINNLLAGSLFVKYEDIFYMTEVNKVEFIEDKNFLLNHDFCDIPGLSEYQGTSENIIQIEEKKETPKESDNINEKMEIGMKQFGIVYKQNNLISTNSKIKKEKKTVNKEEILGDEKEEDDEENVEEDDIFYNVDVEKEKTYLTKIFSILSEYIDGAILMLSVENYYFEENFIIITKLRKVIKKEINNFLIVLNKMDLSDNPKRDIEKCKGMFMQKFPKCKTFNLNLNTFIALSTLQLQNELLMKTSFPHLIKFHFYNYLSNIKKEKKNSISPVNYSFIDHLRDIIKKVKIMKIKEIKEKLDKLNSSENISEIESNFKSIIKEIKEKFRGEEIYLGISGEDFINVKKDKKDDDDNIFNVDEDETDDGIGEKNYNDISSFNACDIIKILYIFQKENKLIPQISEEAKNILNYFNQNKFIYKKEPIIKNEVMSENTKLNKEIIYALKRFCRKLKNIKIENEKYQYLTDQIIRIIEYLKIYDVIFIPFLGGSNAGKTTIINGIIGKDILPNDLNECTKRGIIIRYSDSDTISLRKANFKSEKFLDRTNYFFEADRHVICEGEEKVKDTLKGLNFDFNKKEEDSFYYIKTKIKLFDEMELDESYKKIIYLIDFPGYGTGNIFEKEIYNKAMSICNSFIFVVRNTVIKENNTKKVLDSIFNQAKEQKNKLTSKFIKSCLFVLNNDQNQETTKDELVKAKADIQTVINGINSNDINLCFFNAKYYLKYCDNFNYFSNIKNLIDYEYKNYIDNKNHIIKNPESIQSNIQKSFCEYLYKKLINKENLFDAKMKKSQQISPEIESDVTTKLNKINEKEKMKDLKKYEQKIKATLSFYKENINSMEILKESNINEFKDILRSQIKYFNDNMQKELKLKINNIISDLDMFFKKDFIERKKDLKGDEQFLSNINKEKDKLQNLKDENKKKILKIEETFKNHIKDSLKSKRDLIDNLLKSKNYKEVLKEINDEIKSNLKDLSSQIKEFLNYNKNKTLEIYNSAKSILDIYAEGKNNFKINTEIEKYISKEIGDENKKLDEDILDEIKNSCESLSNIFQKKGFMDWFSSLFSSKNYLENIIDMIIDTFINKVEHLFKVLRKTVKNYLNDLKYSIDQNANLVTMKFSEEQLIMWKDLCLSYEETRKIILKIKY